MKFSEIYILQKLFLFLTKSKYSNVQHLFKKDYRPLLFPVFILSDVLSKMLYNKITFYFSSSSSSSGVSKTPTSSFKSRNGIGNPTDSITIPVITGTPADEDLDHQDTVDNDKLLDDPSSKDCGEEKPSRKGRIERGADARRYHTAGAIEDIKVGATVIRSIVNEFNYDQGPSINYVHL